MRYLPQSVCVFLLLTTASVGIAADADGFKPIFDGKIARRLGRRSRLLARRGRRRSPARPPKETRAKHNTFLIWRGGKPADFELKAEFRMPNAGFANSGIQFRSWEGPGEVAGQRLSGRHGQPRTPTPASATARASAASWPSAARRPSSARTTSRRSSSKFAEPHELGQGHQEARLERVPHHRPGQPHHPEDQRQLMCEVTDEDTKARAGRHASPSRSTPARR